VLYIAGLASVIFSEPLGLPGACATLGGIVLAGAVMISFFILLIAMNLPADVKLTAVDADRVDSMILEYMGEYEDAGFTIGGPALEVGMTPPAILVPMIDEANRMYGTIFRTGTQPPRVSYDIVSIFEDYGGLTTGPSWDGTTLPGAPGSHRQYFAGADVATLREQHLAALRWLAAHGIRARAISADTFAHDIKAAIGQQRRAFLARPVRGAVTAILRTVLKRTPHQGPIESQPVARRELQRSQHSSPSRVPPGIA
jgi:hypothetical protein